MKDIMIYYITKDSKNKKLYHIHMRNWKPKMKWFDNYKQKLVHFLQKLLRRILSLPNTNWLNKITRLRNNKIKYYNIKYQLYRVKFLPNKMIKMIHKSYSKHSINIMMRTNYRSIHLYKKIRHSPKRIPSYLQISIIYKINYTPYLCCTINIDSYISIIVISFLCTQIVSSIYHKIRCVNVVPFHCCFK